MEPCSWGFQRKRILLAREPLYSAQFNAMPGSFPQFRAIRHKSVQFRTIPRNYM